VAKLVFGESIFEVRDAPGASSSARRRARLATPLVWLRKSRGMNDSTGNYYVNLV
jgi:hypothetical protein